MSKDRFPVKVVRMVDSEPLLKATEAFEDHIIGARLNIWPHTHMLQAIFFCASDRQAHATARQLQPLFEAVDSTAATSLNLQSAYVSSTEKLVITMTGDTADALVKEQYHLRALRGAEQARGPYDLYLSLGGLSIYDHEGFNYTRADALRAMRQVLPADVSVGRLSVHDLQT